VPSINHVDYAGLHSRGTRERVLHRARPLLTVYAWLRDRASVDLALLHASLPMPKGGSSRSYPAGTAVSVARGDMDIVVTEHGVADVREKTVDEWHHGLAERRRGPTCESSKRRHCAKRREPPHLWITLPRTGATMTDLAEPDAHN
jgi:hypothetical protein